MPYTIINYLMDMPDAYGYIPPDDNAYPRCRLKKLLWYDEPNPLAKPMPTAAQVKSMLFSADEPDINTDEQKQRHPKGYRLFAQRGTNQSLMDAQTLIKIYPGRIVDESDFRSVITFNCEIWANYALVTNTKTTAYDRTFDIEQCIREALAGVDIAGVGCVRFTRNAGGYNGSEVLYTDGSECGRILYFSVNWSEGGGEKINTNNIIPA